MGAERKQFIVTRRFHATAFLCISTSLALLTVCTLNLHAEQETTTRTERFDRDPGWDGNNNRSNNLPPAKVTQDFGFSLTSHAGGNAGEAGGIISPAAEAAYYAKVIPKRSFEDTLIASGKINVAKNERSVLLGFFNADTINEWRTPNTLCLRIVQHRGGGDFFNVFVDYTTSRWRSGAVGFGQAKPEEFKPEELIRFATGTATHTWSLRYEPSGNDDGGAITATFDDHTVVRDLHSGYKADGATFDHFGLLNAASGAHNPGILWVDDLNINGETEAFDVEPKWEGLRNRDSYLSTYVRPRFDFGFSPTHYAGGEKAGEMGGLVFSGDERYPDRMAYYADRLEELTLEKPLKASGKVSFRQGVTDSMSLIGFFHSERSMKTSKAQTSTVPENFLGIAIEGPSEDGFFFYPVYATSAPDQPGGSGQRATSRPSSIYPDGHPHDWTLEYLPADAKGKARIVIALDGKVVDIELLAVHKAAGAHFNRFGIVTTHTDGNGQKVFYDELTYTARQ